MEQSAAAASIPAVEGFFTWPSDRPQLIGSRCTKCGRYYFPRVVRCTDPDCEGPVEEVLLSTRGTLWSYTWQYYMPPLPYHPPDNDPKAFKPYGVGLVELPEGIRVVGMLTGCGIEDLRIGMAVEMVVERMYRDAAGRDVLTWKFRPASRGCEDTPLASRPSEGCPHSSVEEEKR